MLSRRWTNIKPTLVQRLVFAGCQPKQSSDLADLNIKTRRKKTDLFRYQKPKKKFVIAVWAITAEEVSGGDVSIVDLDPHLLSSWFYLIDPVNGSVNTQGFLSPLKCLLSGIFSAFSYANCFCTWPA